MHVPAHINASVLLSDDEVDDLVQYHPSLVGRAKLMAHVAVTNALLRIRNSEVDELQKLKRENQVLKSELARLSAGHVSAEAPMPWGVRRDGKMVYFPTRSEARLNASVHGGTVVDCRSKE